MKRRTCGTCGFFEEGDLAGTGWCNHPQRRVSIDLKIMVRKGELACRDGWSRDLWAPRGDGGTTAQPADEPSQGPVPPISPEEMTQLVKGGHMDLDEPLYQAAPVDVVVGEAPALPPPDDRATLLSHDPRAAIEAARQRHVAKSTHSGQSTAESDLPSSEDPHEPQREQPRSQAMQVNRQPANPLRPIAVVPAGLSTSPARSMRGNSARQDETDAFSTVPDVRDGVELPRHQPRRVPPPIAGKSEELPDDPRRASLQRLRERQSRSPGVSAPRRQLTPAEAQHYQIQDENPGREPGGRNWRGLLGREQRLRVHAEEAAPVDWYDADLEENEATAWPEGGDIERSSEFALDVDPIEAPGVEDQFEYALTGGLDDDFDIDDTAVHVAPDVPRMCRTCRDFRPADSGERGWCNNSWAFSHRRMVDADELPCESSLGCWWLPHDDIWLSTADVAAHGEPTPLVDEWLSRRETVRRRQGS